MDYPVHSKAVEIEARLRSLLPQHCETEFADQICLHPQETLEKYVGLLEDPYIRGDFEHALFLASREKDDEAYIDSVYKYVSTTRHQFSERNSDEI